MAMGEITEPWAVLWALVPLLGQRVLRYLAVFAVGVIWLWEIPLLPLGLLQLPWLQQGFGTDTGERIY